jgi:hypothetical protein
MCTIMVLRQERIQHFMLAAVLRMKDDLLEATFHGWREHVRLEIQMRRPEPKKKSYRKMARAGRRNSAKLGCTSPEA